MIIFDEIDAITASRESNAHGAYLVNELMTAFIIMINRSFADEIKIYNSVMKVRNFLADNGYGILKVVNLFSFISTDPEGLANNNDTTLIETDIYIWAFV